MSNLGVKDKKSVSFLKQLPSVYLLGVKIHTIALSSLLEIITQVIQDNQKITLAYVNAHALNLAYEEPRFRTVLNNSDVIFCDGFGVKWGGRVLGLEIRHRYAQPDWIDQLCKICCQHDFSIFLLGGRPGVAEKAASCLQLQFPDLQIAGSYHGYFNKTAGSLENNLVIQAINAVKPNILLVGFGMPLQEYWIEENWHQIYFNIALPVGAALDYVSGEMRRGPRLMTDYGFEWLTRLLIEPHRLWKRYVLGNPLFLWRVLKQRFKCLKFDV